jgi:polysaccharide biosynthesis protein VpsQ
MAASRRSAAFLWIAILFALFTLLVVILADLGLVGQIFGWLYSFPNGDKVGHFILMGTLALLASIGFPTTRIRLFALNLLKSSLILAILICIEELSQMMFPDRIASYLDLAASLAGIFSLGELGAYLKHRLN